MNKQKIQKKGNIETHRQLHIQDRSLRFGQLLFLLQRLERHPTEYGTAGPFTPSEIHMIDAIGSDRSIKMSELATKLNVTKGAVTQLARQLEKKGAVRRSSHPSDRRAVLLSLTDIGIQAYKAQDEVRSQFYKHLYHEMNSNEMAIFEKGIDITIKLLQRMLGEE